LGSLTAHLFIYRVINKSIWKEIVIEILEEDQIEFAEAEGEDIREERNLKANILQDLPEEERKRRRHILASNSAT